MSMSPSDSPSSRWSFGLSSFAGSPTVSSTTNSSSPPAGTPSMMTLPIAMCAAVNACSAVVCSASAALTCSASSLASASRAGRSSARSLPAAPTRLLAAFGSARRLSAAEMAERRAASASSSASTSPGCSPRARCDARTRSGSSRSSLRSITTVTLLLGVGPAALRSRAPRKGRCVRAVVATTASSRRRGRVYEGAAAHSPRRAAAQPHNFTTATLVTSFPLLYSPSATETGLDAAEAPPKRAPWWQSLQATPTRRGLLLTALGGLLIAGLITALPRSVDVAGPLAATSALGPRGNDTFDHAKSGDCLNWTEKTPDAAEIVPCSDEHRFEIAETIDMRTFPGSEYGPDAAPPTTARIQQITQEQSQAAARSYLGAKFDPDSRFAVSLLWSGEREWRDAGERRMMCGLQLPGPNNQQLSHKGKVADVDQSKVWSAGTC